MNRLKDIINNMELDDLERLKKDIDTGNISKLLNARMRFLKEKRGGGICPVCHNCLDNNENFTLIFGPKDLKQKASFCGSDCLEYFLYRIKKAKQGEYLGFENKSMTDIFEEEDNGLE